MSLTTHGDIVWSGEDPICAVVVLRIVPKKGFDTLGFYRFISPGQEGLSIHSFNSLQDETIVISPLAIAQRRMEGMSLPRQSPSSTSESLPHR